MTREEQINKAVEEIFNNADIALEDRAKLRMWYKLGVNFADKNPIDRTDWRQVRIQSAIAAMQGMCASKSFFSLTKECIPQIAVKYADALVKELKEE